MAVLLNIDRLIEDLTATLPLLNSQAAEHRPMHPSSAVLEALGATYLSNDPLDVRAARLRSHPQRLQGLVTNGHVSILSDRVRLNYFLAAIAYAGCERAKRHSEGSDWDWNIALEWLVLRGISQYQLWAFISRGFISELHSKSIRTPGGLISPLQFFVLRSIWARQDWPMAGEPGFDNAFKTWFLECGLDQFGLFWTCTHTKLLKCQSVRRPEDSSASSAYDLLAPGQSVGSDLVWPASLCSPRAARHRPTSRIAYQSFGSDFPCLALNCLSPSLIDDGAWLGLVRIAPDHTHVEMLDTVIGLQLPPTWLPYGILILHLEVNPFFREALWVRLLWNEQVIDVRPAEAYGGALIKLLLPDRPPSPTSMLQFQFALKSSAASASNPAGIYAKLFSIAVWQSVLR